MQRLETGAERGGITSINGDTDHWWGVESTLVIVTTRGGSGHYKWSVRGTDGKSGGNQQKWLIMLCNGLSIFVDDVLGGNFRNMGVGRRTRHKTQHKQHDFMLKVIFLL